MSKSVGDRLRDAALLFDQRNTQYGDNYKTIGPVLHAMYPRGLTVSTPGEWQRLYTIVMQVMKTTRYAQNISRGGHEDSLDDLAVYSIMAAHTDQIEREQEVRITEIPIPRSTPPSGRLEVSIPRRDPVPLYVVGHGLTLQQAKAEWRQGCQLRRAVWAANRYLDQYSALSMEDNTSYDWVVVMMDTDPVDPPEAAVDDEWRSDAAARRA